MKTKTSVSTLVARHRKTLWRYFWNKKHMPKTEQDTLKQIADLNLPDDKAELLMNYLSDRMDQRVCRFCVLPYQSHMLYFAKERPRRLRFQWKEGRVGGDFIYFTDDIIFK